MKVQFTALAMAMALALAVGMVSGACSSFSGSKSGTGGSPVMTGGAGGAGGGASCSNVAPCGGNVVGTWTATSSCLNVSGTLNVGDFGVGCATAAVTGSLHVSGTWTANSNGTYTDNTITSGDEQITLAADCLNVSGTTTTCDGIAGPLQGLGYSGITCTSAAGGGCTCAATVQQTGGIGLVSGNPRASGGYTTSANTLMTDSGASYSYCASGNQMTWTPQSASPTITGTIVLQAAASTTTGAGGTSGTGGAGGSGGSGGSPGTGGTGGATTVLQGPCDLYASGNTPCVAAYSTIRLLSSTYTGPLYQVRKGGSRAGSGGTLQDIGVVPGGFADGAAQDTFCTGATCTIAKLYDQSGKGNHLTVAPAGCYTGTASMPDNESSATGRSLMVGGHKVYALFMVPQDGYRNNAATGMPTGTAAQGVYEVADGKRLGTACCWDFGNASTNNCYGPTGSMNAIYFGTGFWGKGAGNGPWFMGDFEAGVWSGGSGASTTTNASLPASNIDYAFGILKTSTSGTPQYAIKVGNAQSGTLTTAYDGQAPAGWQEKGGIILGIGGDNSNSSLGTFFEGAITAGRPSDATDAAVLLNVQAAGYGN